MKMTELKSPAKGPTDVKKEHSTPTSKSSGDSKSQQNQNEDRKSDVKSESRHGDRDKGDRGRRGGHGGPHHGGGRNQYGHSRGGHGGGQTNRGSSRDRDGNSGNRGFDGDRSYGGNQPSSEPKEPKKFTGRCRLFVGNITPDTTEEQFKEMFIQFGEVSEVFVNAARGFGFIRLDYRINAEKAKVALDGEMRNNRVLRVRFATHGAALKVTNLSPYISNEILEGAFSQFGEVERAVVIVDDRGRPTGDGIVEFARKPGATAAMKRINEGVFLLSAYPRPVHVEPLEQRDEEDGQTEKFIQRNDLYRIDREKDPRFALPGSFEFEFALKWRRIDEMEKERIEMVKKEMDAERANLEGEMETAMFDYQAEQIRQDLLRQQEELKRLEEMKNEQMRRRQEMDMRRQEESRMREDGDRRRQEMMMRGGRQEMRGPDMRGPEMRGQEMRGQEMRGQEIRGPEMRGPEMRGQDMQPGMSQGGQSGSRGREEVIRGGSGMRDSPSGRNRSSGPGTPPMPPPPIPPGMSIEQGSRGQGGQGGFGGGQNIGINSAPAAGNMGSSPNIGGQNQGTGAGVPMQRQNQFEGNQGGFRGGPGAGGNFNPAMGGGGGGMGGGPGGPGQGNPYQGNMRNNQNMGDNDRRRDRTGGHRDDYGDMKRMRRY